MPPFRDPSDNESLGTLLERHRPRLVAMVRRRIDPTLSPRLDEDDVVNEAFLVARRKWAGFESRSDEKTYAWLYGIVRNCLLEAWRRETRAGRDLRREQPWPEQSSVCMGLGLVNPTTSPSAAAIRGESQQKMRYALTQLADHDREILWMRHYDQLTFPQAAEVLEISETAATVRYVRALQRLKALWRRLYPREGLD